jgi:chromosome segregation ATPase
MIAFITLCASIAGADFYKYVDEDGNVRYTDDATLVPDAQKDAAIKYQEAPVSASPPAQVDAAAPPMDAADSPAEAERIQPVVRSSAAAAAKEVAIPADRNQWRQQLEDEKDSLDESYRTLNAEIEAFQAEKAQADTPEEIMDYNERVTGLNQKIQAYEERRRNLNRQIEAYNSAARKTDEKPE